MSFFGNLLKRSRSLPPGTIVVVSGLPRSGTSMMMRMLEAGGLPVFTDKIRESDVDNPEGYYELEVVKQLTKGNIGWLEEAERKAVKVISALLSYLPEHYNYRVLFMSRKMEEVLASQQKMLVHRDKQSSSEDSELGIQMEKHVRVVKSWLAKQPNFAVLDVNYNAIMSEPEPIIQQINHFLDDILNEAQMMEIVEPDLYRNRA